MYRVQQTTIRAKSVGPLRHIYQRFSLLHFFNVEPHRTEADSTIKRNIETRDGKGEFNFRDKGL